MKPTILSAALFIAGIIVLLIMPSCATDQGTATPGYYRAGTPGDGVSRFGVFIAPAKQPEVMVVEPTK